MRGCPLYDRSSTKNRHSPARIERPFRAISGLMQSSNQPILRKTGPETLIGVLPDRGVAFAREALECRTIHDLDVTAPIADQPRALKQAGREGDGGAGARPAFA